MSNLAGYIFLNSNVPMPGKISSVFCTLDVHVLPFVFCSTFKFSITQTYKYTLLHTPSILQLKEVLISYTKWLTGHFSVGSPALSTARLQSHRSQGRQ